MGRGVEGREGLPPAVEAFFFFNVVNARRGVSLPPLALASLASASFALASSLLLFRFCHFAHVMSLVVIAHRVVASLVRIVASRSSHHVVHFAVLVLHVALELSQLRSCCVHCSSVLMISHCGFDHSHCNCSRHLTVLVTLTQFNDSDVM